MSVRFTDTEHRLLLAALRRERNAIEKDVVLVSEDDNAVDLIASLNSIERKISSIQRAKVWFDTSEKPLDDEYVLTMSNGLDGRPYYELCWWSDNLYKIDKYDFYDKKGKAGFYIHDSEFGYLEVDGVKKWARIPKEEEDE